MSTTLTTIDPLLVPSDEPHSAPAPRARKRRNAPQDSRQTSAIAEALTFCQVLETDTEIAALLRPLGIDQDQVRRGKTLLHSAQDAFQHRQKAMGEADLLRSEVLRLTERVRKEYYNFRKVAREWVELPGGAVALGLTTRVSFDREQLVLQVRTSYTTAMQPQYQAVLGRVGYKATLLEDLMGDLQDLSDALVRSQKAQGDAQQATRTRDNAVHQLRQWQGRVRRLARQALQERPDLQTRLGL